MPDHVTSSNREEAPATRTASLGGGGSMTAAGTAEDAVAGGGMSDLKRLIRLFTDEDTADLVERQLVVLRRVCKVSKNGFRYSELVLVKQLLPLLETRVSSGQASEFRAPLLKILDICSLAPVRERANQEFTESGLAATRSLFRVLGGALWSSDAGVQSAAATALRKIACGNDPTRPNALDGDGNPSFGEGLHDLRPKPRDINLALLLSCGVVTSAVTFLAAVMTRMLASVADLDDFSSQSSSLDDTSSERRVEPGILGEEEGEVTTPASEQQEVGWQPGVDLAREDDRSTARVRDDQPNKGQADGRGVASDVALTHMVLVSTLELVRELSTDAASSAAMVEAGLVSLLVQAMHAVRSVRDPTLSIAVEMLWNCLEHGKNEMSSGSPAASRTSLVRKARKSNAAFALSSWDGVSALRDTVEALLIGGFRNKDKELRNETIIVASHLASNSRSHALFRTTGMLLLLLRYSTAIETGLADGDPHAAEVEARAFALAGEEASHGSSSFERKEMPELGALADPRNFASMSEVDMELKLLIWSLLSDLCKRDALNVEVVKASPLIETLLMYMDLVVEEGQSADAQPPGMSRSVSLASMPPLGFSQTTSTAFAKTPASLEAGGQARTPGVDKEPGRHPRSPAPRSPRAPMAGCSPARSPHQGQSSRKGKYLTSSECATNTSSSASTKDPSSAAEGEEWEEPEMGLTQLYVPATVVRLPVTSIQLLQGQAMASLLVLAPRCPIKFQALGGHTVTLRLLDRLGSRPENHRLVKVATKMLATVVGLPGLKEELGRVDGVRIMLDRFSDEWKQEQQGGGGAGPRDSRDGGGGGGSGGSCGGGGSEGAGELRTDTVIILCRLCENCPENQEAFRKADGVPTMMAAVKAYCQEQSEAMHQECAAGNEGGGSQAAKSGGSSLGPGGSVGGLGSGGPSVESIDPSLVHIIDCLWCAVVGNRRSEARLLQCEGLDTLLDLLELCPVFMRHQVTGIVADLLRNKRSIPYARAWRSDLNMLSITQLMVRLWVAEEARLGVSRPNGVLQNLWQPLQSHDRGSRRRKWTAQSAKRECSVLPTSGGSMDPMTTPSEYDTVFSAPDCRSDASCAVPEPDDSAGVSPGAPADSVVAGLAAATSARNSQNSSETLSAMTLSLQAGKRAAGAGQSGGRGQETNALHSGVDSLYSKAMGHLDLRGKIASVLGMVGFDGGATDGLGPSDLKASYMASTYMDFRVGEAWQEVAGELEAQHTNPIAADAYVLDTMLERAFHCAQEVKSKQMILTLEQEDRDAEAETAFFAGILFQRDQEIRQAMIKRNALLPGTSKRRLAAKKALRTTTKTSSDKSPRGSAEFWTGSEQGTSQDGLEGERNAPKEASGGGGIAAVAVGSQ